MNGEMAGESFIEDRNRTLIRKKWVAQLLYPIVLSR
jgi:hypothetical protein